MSTISKALTGIIFSAAALTLASANWKNNVNAIYGFTPAGDGYTVFKPTSNFNSLTQLTQDGVYIVDAKTTGFELPGAQLTAAAGLGPGPLTVEVLRLETDGGDPDNIHIYCRARSTDYNNELAGYLVEISAPTQDGSAGVYFAQRVDRGYLYNGDLDLGIGLPYPGTGTVRVTNRLGYSAVAQFTIPHYTTDNVTR